jgi:hypothetical protein
MRTYTNGQSSAGTPKSPTAPSCPSTSNLLGAFFAYSAYSAVNFPSPPSASNVLDASRTRHVCHLNFPDSFGPSTAGCPWIVSVTRRSDGSRKNNFSPQNSARTEFNVAPQQLPSESEPSLNRVQPSFRRVPTEFCRVQLDSTEFCRVRTEPKPQPTHHQSNFCPYPSFLFPEKSGQCLECDSGLPPQFRGGDRAFLGIRAGLLTIEKRLPTPQALPDSP